MPTNDGRLASSYSDASVLEKYGLDLELLIAANGNQGRITYRYPPMALDGNINLIVFGVMFV